MDSWTGHSQDGRSSREQGGEAVLLTDVPAVRGGSGSVAGRAQACSPVFAILDGGLAKAGPLQKRGVPASVCAGGEDTVLWEIKDRVVSQKASVLLAGSEHLPPRHLP